MADTNPKFTAEEEAKIQAAIKAQQDKARAYELEVEIRNRILDAERTQPGKTGY